VVATGFALAKRLKKVPVRAGVCDGFIGNRILAVYRQAADTWSKTAPRLTRSTMAVRDFGYPMGPYQVSDLAGGDIGWATRKRRAATRDPRARYVHIADRICERGWFGQKTGRGWYLYPEGSRTGQRDPECWPSSMPRARQGRRHPAPASRREQSCAAIWPPWSTKAPRWCRGHCPAPAGCGRDLHVPATASRAIAAAP
jgi:3-hydroxyacyl-CoA dehydrogenase